MLRLPVHPHIRGVYFCARFRAAHGAGPSPHTWGLLNGCDNTDPVGRSIPTYVGFTSECGRPQQTMPVHPHIRGVYHKVVFSRVRLLRSIPTYVGFTTPAGSVLSRPPVHPHIRGVYSPFHDSGSPRIGPSPHTWGLRVPVVRVLPGLRSIPTYVGFTIDFSPQLMGPTVHPHIRGVYGWPATP